MSTSAAHRPQAAALALSARCDDDRLHVRLADGREISAPLEWFPLLRDATAAQRANWRLIGRGVGVHWPDVDEDISVETLLRL
jgi:hypothetical protein